MTNKFVYNIEIEVINMQGRIHSIETFGTVDGPGIRFVLFMQGCGMRCLYCHNPDTWTKDGGTLYESIDIVDMVLKYRHYYGNQGAITVSGGEALLQLDFLIELFTLCKEKGIHTCLDTSGGPFRIEDQRYVTLIQVCDLVLLDMKHMDEKKHIKLCAMGNKNVFAFAQFLEEHHKPYWIRHVLVPTISDDDEHLYRLKAWLDTLKMVEKVEILPYHTMGVVKYKQLGIEYPLLSIPACDKERVAHAKAILLGESDEI